MNSQIARRIIEKWVADSVAQMPAEMQEVIKNGKFETEEYPDGTYFHSCNTTHQCVFRVTMNGTMLRLMSFEKRIFNQNGREIDTLSVAVSRNLFFPFS